MLFGFSVGDFLSVMAVVADVISTLRNGLNEHNELISELEVLRKILRQTEDLQLSSTLAFDTIKSNISTCLHTLQVILKKASKNTQPFSIGQERRAHTRQRTALLLSSARHSLDICRRQLEIYFLLLPIRRASVIGSARLYLLKKSRHLDTQNVPSAQKSPIEFSHNELCPDDHAVDVEHVMKLPGLTEMTPIKGKEYCPAPSQNQSFSIIGASNDIKSIIQSYNSASSLNFIGEIVESINKIHEQNANKFGYHHDIRPTNILVVGENRFSRFSTSDFGLVDRAHCRNTRRQRCSILVATKNHHDCPYCKNCPCEEFKMPSSKCWHASCHHPVPVGLVLFIDVDSIWPNSLFFHHLERFTTEPDVQDTAASKNYDYKKMLFAIPLNYIPLAHAIFAWILYAIRPLKEVELVEATIWNESLCKTYPAIRHYFRDNRNIAQFCGGFVRVEPITGVVSFIHSNVNKFLTPEIMKQFPQQYRLNQSSATEKISETCLTYLIAGNLNLDRSANMPNNGSTDYEFSAFSEYVIRFWPIHYKHAESDSEILPRLLQRFLEYTSEERKTWTSRYAHLIDGHANLSRESPLQICSRFGFTELARIYVEMGYFPSMDDDTRASKSCLYLAVENNHWEIAEMLLERDATVNCEEVGSSMPILETALLEGRSDIAKLLLLRGARFSHVKEYNLGLKDLNDIASNAMSCHETASKLAAEGMFENALEWYVLALIGYEESRGFGHPSTIEIVSNIANVFQKQGRFQEALLWYNRALEVHIDWIDLEDPDTNKIVTNMDIYPAVLELIEQNMRNKTGMGCAKDANVEIGNQAINYAEKVSKIY